MAAQPEPTDVEASRIFFSSTNLQTAAKDPSVSRENLSAFGRMTLLILIPLLMCFHSHAQQQKMDSLKHLVQETNDPNAYLELALTMPGTDSSYLMFQRALIYVNDQALESTLYAHISQWELDRGFYALAQKSAFKSLEIGLALHDSTKVSSSYRLLGLIAHGTRLFQKAIEYDQKGISYCGKTNTKTLIAISNNLGLTYMLKGDLFKSVALFQDNLTRANSLQDSLSMAVAHNNLASGFLVLRNYDSAFTHISKTLQISELTQDSIGLMYDSKLMGEYYYYLNQFKKAKSFLYLAWSLDSKFGVAEDVWTSEERPKVYQMLEDIYTKEKNTDSSRYFNNKMFSYYKELVDEQKKNNAGFVFANQEEQLKAITEKENRFRKDLTQYYGIALVLLLSIVGYFMLTQRDGQRKYSPYISLVILILTFEFLLIILDPLTSRITNGQPLLNFAINVLLALTLIPVQKLGEGVFRKFALDIKFKRIDA